MEVDRYHNHNWMQYGHLTIRVACSHCTTSVNACSYRHLQIDASYIAKSFMKHLANLPTSVGYIGFKKKVAQIKALQQGVSLLIISFSWQVELNGQWAMINNVECCCIMNPNACHGSCKQCHQCNSSHLCSMFAYSYTQRKERVGLAIKAKITKVDTVWSDFQHKSRCHFFLSSQQRRQLVRGTTVRESTKCLASFDYWITHEMLLSNETSAWSGQISDFSQRTSSKN